MCICVCYGGMLVCPFMSLWVVTVVELRNIYTRGCMFVSIAWYKEPGEWCNEYGLRCMVDVSMSDYLEIQKSSMST